MAIAVRDVHGREVSLADRYLLEDGRVQLSGVQALTRVLVDQRRADARAGARTGVLVSGYPGSPLGGLDRELERLGPLLGEHDIVHVPGLNEELAATAGLGSQLVRQFGSAYDGVLSIWYGKAPGLDRAGDALRHANYVGTSRMGGAVAYVGDDPIAKSSTIPNASEMALADLAIPVFYPGSVQDVLELGRHAIACSRASGLWCAVKVVTNVADSAASVIVASDRPDVVVPASLLHDRQPHGHLLPPQSLDLERELVDQRLEVVPRYLTENGVNTWEGAAGGWLGIVTGGKPYFDVHQTLADLGLGSADLERLGVRILKLGAIWPLDQRELRTFAAGLEEILVVEEKRPFVEDQLRVALYGMADAPRIVGKRDETGSPALPAHGELSSDVLAPVLLDRLARRVDVEALRPAAERLRRLAARTFEPVVVRTPFFCSGCPHNRSTDVPSADTIVGAGTGCHSMVLLDGTGSKGDVDILLQMGGEGAQWVGVAPFVDDQVFVQNMGDGTFHHSGQLAIRFAVSAGLKAMFKVYYNQAVSMTGGQDVPGAMTVTELTHALAAEGVTRTIVTTEDLSRYKRARLAPNAEVRDRRAILDAQRELLEEPGVTVLVHDQQCAAEKRRLRKRGKLPQAEVRVVINERVCEGCGDCGRKSDCASVRPVDTEFGRKTQIHQPSCNEDYSCLDGDCPSFITVRGPRRTPAPHRPGSALPAPGRAAGPLRVRMAGIGGTGVVTVSQVLGMAALLDGRHILGLDQTGLAQKGGVVVSDLLVADEPPLAASRAPAGGVDVYLALDLPAATQVRNIAAADPERTVAVVSTSRIPTGPMIVDPEQRYPAADQLTSLVGKYTKIVAATLDATAIAEAVFDDDMPANMIVLGAALQAGLLPVSEESLTKAINLNGAAVEKNLVALEWGRASVADPAVVAALLDPAEPDVAPPAWVAETVASLGAREELRRLLEIRLADLAAYQSRGYALRYLGVVASTLLAERRRTPDGLTPVTESVARQLHRLMAYKDEYEVARLHLLDAERAKVSAGFADGSKVYWHLHPPLLRALGMKRKLRLGAWFTPAFRALRALRPLRGTPLDPFGWARVRRTERKLLAEYEELVAAALERLTPGTRGLVVELCETPELIRGFEDIKLESVRRYRDRAAELVAQLDEASGRPVEQPAIIKISGSIG